MKKVIIASDIKKILDEENSFLGRAGIRTYTATSNEKAFALHRNLKANLIIAKLNMPEMSGEKLCSLIRDDNKLRNVSIIIICSETEADLERCVQCRANIFVSSPIDSAVLLGEAHRLLHIAPRKSCRISVRVIVEGKSKEMSFIGCTGNISASGMLFQTSVDLFEGDIIICSFSLPGFKKINTYAEIVRLVEKKTGQNTKEYGARFFDLGIDAASAIKAFIETNNRNTIITSPSPSYLKRGLGGVIR